MESPMKKHQKNDDTHMRCPYCESTKLYFTPMVGYYYCPDCYRLIWEWADEKNKPLEETESSPPATTKPRGSKDPK
jgi:hypothetical protein